MNRVAARIQQIMRNSYKNAMVNNILNRRIFTGYQCPMYLWLAFIEQRAVYQCIGEQCMSECR
jgi:hypothetical protein